MEVHFALPESLSDVEDVRETLLAQIKLVNPDQFELMIESMEKT